VGGWQPPVSTSSVEEGASTSWGTGREHTDEADRGAIGARGVVVSTSRVEEGASTSWGAGKEHTHEAERGAIGACVVEEGASTSWRAGEEHTDVAEQLPLKSKCDGADAAHDGDSDMSTTDVSGDVADTGDSDSGAGSGSGPGSRAHDQVEEKPVYCEAAIEIVRRMMIGCKREDRVGDAERSLRAGVNMGLYMEWGPGRLVGDISITFRKKVARRSRKSSRVAYIDLHMAGTRVAGCGRAACAREVLDKVMQGQELLELLQCDKVQGRILEE